MIEHLERYRIFWVTATAGSLSAAAAKLSISQPAVSHVIKRLELHLNVKLFERLPRGVRLTPDGQKLFTYVGDAMSLLLFEVPLTVPIPPRRIVVATLKNAELSPEASMLAEALP